jgi:acetylornithine/N-succinyldiaminopimelate aminotransferase
VKPLSALPPDDARRLRGVLFDLDDTFLSHGVLEPAAYEALWSLYKEGLTLVAVTGRPCGWAEVLVRQWPLAGCVAENGALYVVREGAGVARHDSCDKAERHARRLRLAGLVERVREAVPEAALTDDVEARVSDVTWDVGERVTLPEDRVRAIVEQIEHAGARWTRSSVHLHATFDADDKASGALRFCARELGEDEGAALVRFAFVGDSGNDAPGFAVFRETFGVANVQASLSRLSIPPRYVARRAMGQGFAEIACEIIAKRCANPLPAMASNSELVTLAHQRLYPNYRPAPIALVRGRGCELFDADGRRWLDLCAGVAVCSVGHAHPTLTRAIAEQAASLMHVSNYFYNEPNIRLADELCRRSGFDRAFFCNSGTEANEAMLKLARHHFFAQGQKERVRVIAFDDAFHGRSLGALSMTGTPKYREGFGPLGPVSHVAYGDEDAVERAMGPDVCAIIVEPLQGEGGVVPAPPGFLARLRSIADRHRVLLLADEVQTGIGRLGRFLGFDGSGVRPDAAALAKGLGGGFPIGAMLTTEKLSGALPAGTHGSTFGGNALASAAALAVLRILDEEKLVEGAGLKGEALGEMLQKLVHDLPEACAGARGQGLLRGLVLKQGLVVRDLLPRIQEAGVLLTAAGERVLRFSPPLVVTLTELEEGVRAVKDVLSAIQTTGRAPERVFSAAADRP